MSPSPSFSFFFAYSTNLVNQELSLPHPFLHAFSAYLISPTSWFSSVVYTHRVTVMQPRTAPVIKFILYKISYIKRELGLG